MSVLAEFFIGDDALARQYDSDQTIATRKAEYTNLTIVELSKLWRALTRSEWEDSILDRFRTVAEDGGRSTVAIPDDFLRALTESEDRLDDAAAQWAATEEMDCEPGQAREIIDSLISLAWDALGSGKHMYLWNCP